MPTFLSQPNIAAAMRSSPRSKSALTKPSKQTLPPRRIRLNARECVENGARSSRWCYPTCHWRRRSDRWQLLFLKICLCRCHKAVLIMVFLLPPRGLPFMLLLCSRRRSEHIGTCLCVFSRAGTTAPTAREASPSRIDMYRHISHSHLIIYPFPLFHAASQSRQWGCPPASPCRSCCLHIGSWPSLCFLNATFIWRIVLPFSWNWVADDGV